MNCSMSACEWMLGCTSQSMMRSRLLAASSSARIGRSMTSLMRSSLICSGSCRELQPREGFERVISAHSRNDTRRQMRRHRIVTVELPVRIVGRKQEHLVGADLLDHVSDTGGIRRPIERLHGDADMVANDGSRLALDPRHLDAHA